MKKILFFFFFFIFSVPGFCGVITFDIGAHKDFLDYNGGTAKSAFTFPSMGISFGGKDPGWHFRGRINTSYRDFHAIEGEMSSTLRGVLGIQWIFEPVYFFNPFIYAGIEYRISEIKYKKSSIDLEYSYARFKRWGIPVSAGVLVPFARYFVFSLELEAGIIPLSSSYHPGGYYTGKSVWYNEYDFGLYAGLGIYY